MNSNTVANALAENNPSGAPATLVNPTGASEFINPNGTPLILNVPSVASNGVLVGPQDGGPLSDGLWYADGKPFHVRVSGLIQPAQVSQTFTLVLMLVKGQTAADQIGVSLATWSQALDATSVYTNFSIELDLLWDSQSQRLNGTYEGAIDGVVISRAATVKLTAVGQLQFALVPKLSAAANQGNVTLTQFFAEVI